MGRFDFWIARRSERQPVLRLIAAILAIGHRETIAKKIVDFMGVRHLNAGPLCPLDTPTSGQLDGGICGGASSSRMPQRGCPSPDSPDDQNVKRWPEEH